MANENQTMQEIGLLNIRINDFMVQLNKTVKALVDENQAKDTEIQKLKGQVVKAINADVPAPPASS